MGSNGVAYSPLEVEQKLPTRTPSSASNKNIRHKRNLREKRRPTGIVHIMSTESAGGTSSETEEEGLDDDLNVKKNTKMNEIVFLPMPTAHLRALAAEHAAAARDQDEDPDDEEEDEDQEVLEYSEGAREGADHSNDPGDMRMENERLRDQLKFKDKYIKQLEARVFQLEIQHKHSSFIHSNSPKKRNQ